MMYAFFALVGPFQGLQHLTDILNVAVAIEGKMPSISLLIKNVCVLHDG